MTRRYYRRKKGIAKKEKHFFKESSPAIQTKEEKQPFFQAKGNEGITVGEPGDKYEVEADATAEKIVKKLQGNGADYTPFFKESNTATNIQAKCTDCAEDEIQKKESKEIQREGGMMPSSQNLSKQLSNSGSGDPLPENIKNDMESAFYTDFSEVRIHTGNHAVQMSEQLNAQAFTNGNDIYFNQNKFRPATSTGQNLLAHELTHTLQQSNKSSHINRKKLTESDKLEDLQSDILKDDARLQQAFDHSPLMRYGEKSVQGGVKVLQRALKELGYDFTISFKKTGDADGIFGGETYKAIKEFQTENELEFKDGIVGRETLQTLDSKFLNRQIEDQCNFTYAPGTFDRKAKLAFLDKHVSTTDRPLASKIIQDLCEVTPGQLTFSSEEELRREVIKRLSTSKLLQESQTSGAFAYPEASAACPGHVGHPLLDARVNKSARNLWKGPILETRPGVGHYFFELTEDGKKQAYEAIRLLFTPQENICDKTLIHCYSLITLVHTLAFADAIGKTVFNEKIRNGQIKIWLTFDGMAAETDDKTATPVTISTHQVRPSNENDLLIGDHVIFWNHLAYDAISLKNPGPWRLENAILVDKNNTGEDLYEGHGATTATRGDMLRKIVENYNFHVWEALPLTKKVDEGDTAAEASLTSNFPQIDKKNDNQWHVNELDNGRNSTRSVRDYVLREITNANDSELIGLKDPDNPSVMNRVRRPKESI